MPDTGSSATRYIATSDPNGFSGSAPCEVLRRGEIHEAFELVRQQRRLDLHGRDLRRVRAVRRLEAIRRLMPVTSPLPSCSSLPGSRPFSSGHAARPSAAEGLRSRPSGSATVMFFSSVGASPSAFSASSWGTCTSTVSPLGLLASCAVGLDFDRRHGTAAGCSRPSRAAGAVAANGQPSLGASQESASDFGVQRFWLPRGVERARPGRSRNGGGLASSGGWHGPLASSALTRQSHRARRRARLPRERPRTCRAGDERRPPG